MTFGQLELFFSALHQERKRRNEKVSNKVCINTLRCGYFSFIYRHWVSEFLIKALTIMSISTNIYRPYVYDPLSLPISVVNYSINLIVVIGQSY